MNLRRRMRRLVAAVAVAMAVALPSTRLEIPLFAVVSLTSVAPLGASADVSVQIIGTGFDPTLNRNVVLLTPQGGTAVQVAPESIVTLDASKGLRRLGIRVPAGLPIGTALVQVRNTTTGELSSGRALEIVQIALPEIATAARGAQQINVRVAGSPNVQFVAGRSAVTFGAGVSVNAVQVLSPTVAIATITVGPSAALGPRTILVVNPTQTAQLTNGFAIVDPNRPPTITSAPVLSGREGDPYTYQLTATDPDNDAVTFRLVTSPSGMTITPSGAIAWTPQAAHLGSQSVVVEASDGRGGTNQQAYHIAVAAAPALVAIELTPEAIRFAQASEARPLHVAGRRNDGQIVNLTSPASGTTYQSSNRFVATVDSEGVVTAVANGDATITARNGALSDIASIAVEIGVTLDTLQLTPSAATLRAPGATQPLTLTGQFSDATTRDLTTAAGTTFESSDTSVATISSDGRVTAIANGSVTMTARHDTRSAVATVTVSISGGTGFLRGEVFDDTRGLPMNGATATLISDGGGALAPPVAVPVDDRGRFALPGRAGDAVVVIAKDGFTSVERTGVIPVSGAATLLDARLTPLDARLNPIGSAIGGTATNQSQRAVLQVPPGGLTADAALTLTIVSPQGLAGLLPAGWSPIAAVHVGPANVTFGFPLTLTLTNPAAIAVGSTTHLVRYESATHSWIGAGTATLAPTGLAFSAAIDTAGHYALILPDAAPFTPPSPAAGAPLFGVARPENIPPGLSAAGDVVPRTAPPGDGARAVGRIGLASTTPAPSGTFVQARVNERFDLLDSRQIVTQPFTQDLVAYAVPAPTGGGRLGATFPITPSRSFTIQELMLGVIRLDVTGFDADGSATIVGPAGGTIADAEGDALEIPAGALGANAPIAVRRLSSAESVGGTITGFDVLAAIQVDAIGVTFAQSAILSIGAAGISAQDQILITSAFTDATGQRRLRLVAIGELVAGRVVTRATFGTVPLQGIRGGGDFVFLRAQQPIGIIRGSVTRTDGAPVAAALVTTDSSSIADFTSETGAYIVPGRVGVDVALRALHSSSGDTASASVRLDAAGETLIANLTLAVVGPTVVAIAPPAGATNVPLDASIAIDFSEALDPASVTESSVALLLAGSPIAGQRTVSADRRRVVVTPSAPLTGTSTYSLSLTSALRDLAGNPLTGFAGASFTTLDPSRPPQPQAGLVVAELPDEDGFVLVTGTAGVAASNSPVTLTNVRTQETMTVLALPDGSFRLRVAAAIGDELVLTLRGPDGRDLAISLTQFQGADGSTSIGAAGGTIAGDGGRTGRIVPRALAQPGVFRFDAADSSGLPALPTDLAYVDTFSLRVGGAVFKTPASLTLTDTQNRFAPATALAPPLAVSGELTTPTDALVNSALRFSAVVQDADGLRHTASAMTTIVGGTPDAAIVETSHVADFPTVQVFAPRETIPGQLLRARAIAPAARIDLQQQVPSGVLSSDTLLLVQPIEVGAESRLLISDRLAIASSGGTATLRTNGGEFPGITADGRYAIVAAHDVLIFVTGLASGVQTIVVADGLPFAFRTSGPNGRFVLPLRANQAFTLRFFNVDGQARGTATGQAPAAGTIDVGDPLGAAAGRLTVRAEPDERSIVDINTPLVFRFSEPVDARTLSSALVVSDAAGNRVFGQIVVAGDGLRATFTPSRRWRFATTYRYGLGLTLLARSGARLSAAFAGQFTTFSPSVVGTIATASVRDVAISGATALVATDTALQTIDIASPRDPRTLGQVPVAGGANAVTLLSGTPLTDRNGNSIAGPFALVGAGSPSAGGRLQTVDISTAASPTAIGSTQLSNASGQSPPANVPAFTGTPTSIAVGDDGRAFVAIESVGASSVLIGQAIPLDPSTPARGAGPRYPTPGAESAHDVARLDNRLLVAGAAGLTVLDVATLHRVGGISTTGDARGVAALTAFRMDVNGDGVVVPESEVFDLAVVANGLDGTLQFYRVPEASDPVLLSAVRFAGAETTAVRLDATERLAYVALAGRGLAIVDLDGPASVQPIDLDRNGLDDRILGSVSTSGAAARVAVDGSRGVALVADGPAGAAVVQLIPPRTRFTTLLRDPISTTTGDEESILESREAFATDDAVQVTVDAVSPSESGLVLVIQGSAASGARLTFADGSSARPLTDGLNALSLRVDAANMASTGDVTLSAQTASGAVLGTLAVHIAPPDFRGATLRSLRIDPLAAVIAQQAANLQLRVGGVLSDGRTFNVTRAETGTAYTVSDTVVASIDANGLALPGAGGTVDVEARNGNIVGNGSLRVERGAVLTGLTASSPYVTLTSLAERQTLDVVARFSDGSTRPAASVQGTSFTSGNTSVLSVDAAGVLAAVSNGVSPITVANGAFSAQIKGAVELRTAPAIAAIDLAPFTSTVTTDEGQVQARAVITGTGSLEGLPIIFSITGASVAPVTGLTSHAGVALALIDGFTAAATITVTASIVNPANGQTLTDSEMIAILPGSADNEPNSSDSTASRLVPGRTITGTLDGTTDLRDAFRTDASAAGTLTVTLTLPDGAATAGLTVVVRNASGAEIGRFTPTGRTSKFSVSASDGQTFVSVEGNAAVSYSLSVAFVQRELAVASVAPLSGAAATLVTIDGAGFSTDPSRTKVLFGGIAGKVVSSTGSRIQVQVPANAVDGDIEIVSGDRRLRGPRFATGNNGTVAPVFVLPSDPENARRDPITRTILDVTRLHVFFDALVTRAQAESKAQQAGATVVGVNPTLNAYMFEFVGNQTIAGLEVRRRQLLLDPQVRFVSRQTALQTRVHPIDARDWAGNWGTSSVKRGVAYNVIKLFDAFEAIRSTPPFDVSPAPFHSVRVAVLDTGFDPRGLFDFQTTSTSPPYVLLFTRNSAGSYVLSPYRDSQGHGTAVTSVISAGNEGLGLSGVLNGVLKPGEPLPFATRVYQIQDPPTLNWDVGAVNAFTDIVRLNATGVEFDAVNISVGNTYESDSDDYRTAQQPFREVLGFLAGRTVVTPASGNDGVDTRFDVPSALSLEMSHVWSIGGTAAGNQDNTGEGPDERAIFGTPGGVAPGIACSTPYVRGSACGPSITIAAPAEDVMMSASNGYLPPGNYLRAGDSIGTSFAAPMVAGAAALIQAIRDGTTPFAPDRLRQLFLDTADDISRTWTPFTMRRLNVLAAVRAVLRIDPDNQHIYVADNDAPLGNDRKGRIIGINIDPNTGLRRDGPFDKEIELGFGLPSAVFLGTNPTALIASPTAPRLYAIVTSTVPVGMGDGVLVVNTLSNRAENFIPLSGEPFPPVPGASGFSPVTLPTQRPGLAISPDGKLLYVGAGRRLIVINTVSEQVVQSFADLPAPYNTLAASRPANAFSARISGIDSSVLLAPPTDVGRTITALTISPNGRTLYAAIQSGGGGGQQPGAALAIDINLFNDADANAPGLQTDLSTYLSVLSPSMPMQTTSGSTGTSLGDEPSAVAVSADGNHLYLVNGGMASFSAISAASLDLNKFYQLVGGPIMSLGVGGGSGLLGVMTSLDSFNELSPQLFEEMRRDLREIANGGVTFIAAPGLTGVFNAQPTSGTFGQQTQLFSGDVVFGWSPDPANGGLIVNQFRIPDVFAQRPFGMTMHPNGQRAIVPYFQTGNFGILDINHQASLRNPALAGQSATSFHGMVAVTRALPLDNHLWPKRGAFRSNGQTVQSPDEALLFTWQAEYAQNGKFAAASHAGGRLPYTITAPLPDWQQDLSIVGALSQLGFSGFSGTDAQDPDGVPVHVGTPYTFIRGGGAITVINDALVGADLTAHIGQTLPTPIYGTPRPYFATAPLRSDAVSHVFQYHTTGRRSQLYQPRGIAITPFVQMEAPRFGDRATLGTAIQFTWRDARITHYEVRVDTTSGSTVALKGDALPAASLASKSFSIPLSEVTAGSAPHPVDGQTYRIWVTVYTGSNTADILSETSVLVRFGQ
ncbi:MAG TPA: Ig-like domain-containing protein [Vicinamibacterales bacterium]